MAPPSGKPINGTAPNVQPISIQIYQLMQALEKVPAEKAGDSTFKEKIFSYVRDVPPASRPPDLTRLLCKVFTMSEIEVNRVLDHTARRKDFDDLVPRKGWLRDYVEFTRSTEPPTVFHFFAGAVAISTALARNVYFPRGAQSIFPNLCVVIVAPSGKCRKTSACNIAVDITRLTGANVLADKLTPEALVEAFKDRTDATGLIYAPELAVFLGKQKYQEGMVPMLTALFDCPTLWKSATIMRGEAELRNVAMSFLGASTIDWIQTAIPKDAFGGGFMSRLLFVVQEDTPRSFPLPPPLDQKVSLDLRERLRKLTQLRGTFTMDEDAKVWYSRWYSTRSDRNTENRFFAGYFERKPDHLLRLAEVLAVSAHSDSLVLDVQVLQEALAVLDWIEEWLPGTFDQIQETSVGADQVAILHQLKKAGGAEKHSILLRKNIRKMDAQQFRKLIDTLRVSELIEYDANNRMYYLTPQGWK